MLPAAHRLREGHTFRTAVRGGTRAGSHHLVVHLWTPPGATGPARVGLVVTRAVGTAVTRNLVKRRLRHLTRQQLSRLPEGSVLVVRALPPAAGAPAGVLGAELSSGLDRLLRRRRSEPRQQRRASTP